MNRDYHAIKLFKKNREIDSTDYEPLVKEDSSNTEQKIPELIIRPLESKERENSSTNSELPPLLPNFSTIAQTLLGVFTENRNNSPLNLLKNKDILSWPIWSIFKSPK
ncbi:hypothetical protein DP73_13605 [Desulfosporosinus sp. HMP52]|uniref:hypothetical protein n=1 Tax=Desulfosporosinus sp. HMP52 TaxID=1487923 RepID=UPI00051FE64E|nr:hypothetical protein [Desulfosporosinus sp. HMP52]KGK88131.1 hypothetical protein DP73_13605 [Desulfosporosinus sp. HMP52]